MLELGRFLDRTGALLSCLCAAIGAASVVAMTVLITVNVLLRYALNQPLGFAEEYSAYLYMAIVYLGLSYTARAGEHINVDFFEKRFGSKWVKGILELIALVAALAVTSAYFWFAWGLFVESMRTNKRAQTIVLTPLWIPQALLWAGLLCLALEVIVLMGKKLIELREDSYEMTGEDTLGIAHN